MTMRRYEVGAGTATVLARPGLVLLVCDEEIPPALFAAVGAAQDAPGGWQELGRQLGELLGTGAVLPAFGAVAELEGGILVFLAGAVVATLTDAHGQERRLSGVDAATWIDRVVAPDEPVIALAPEGQPVPQDPARHHLVEGAVPAGWVRSVDPTASVPTARTPEASFPEPPAPPTGALAAPGTPDPAGATVSPVAGGPPPPPVVPAPEPEPLDAAPAPTPPPIPPAASGTSGRATMAAPRTAATSDIEDHTSVEGVLCPSDHLNAPEATVCRVCGGGLGDGPHQRVSRPRPSLGFLVLDDGATYALDGRYVLGRDPSDDPLVASGEGRPIPLDDPQRSVSRVHAEVRLAGWDVQLLDRGSTNGTYVLRGGDWEPVSSDEPRLIQPGTRMAIGQRTFVYEAPRPV